MWKVVSSSNLNSPLKLFFYSSILTNNNLLLKIYCENIVVKFLNYNFLSLYYFLFFHFILLHTRVLYPPSFIYFSPPEPSSNISFALLSSSKKKNFALLIREKRETEIEKEEKDWERSAWASTTCISTATPASPPPGWVRSACLLFFFFFHTCLFLFKFILRIGFCFVVCVLCLD